MFHISDESNSEAEMTEDQETSSQSNSASQQQRKHLAVPDRIRGDLPGRQRNLSMNEEDLLETGISEGNLLSDPIRPRSHSAPPAFWAAKKYGQQLRRMSDEFDILLDNKMKRVKSAGTARQMSQSPSWLKFLWSHQESDESRPAE